MTTCRWKMRDAETGEERSGTEEYAHGADVYEFWWIEGNMACDSNRSGTFYDSDAPDCENCCRMGPGFTRRFELLELWHGDTRLV